MAVFSHLAYWQKAYLKTSGWLLFKKFGKLLGKLNFGREPFVEHIIYSMLFMLFINAKKSLTVMSIIKVLFS